MRIGYPDGDVSLHHELVSSSRIRSFKPHLAQIAHQVLAFDWTKPRHYATSLTVSSIPSTTGRGRCLYTRKKIHSSSTSASCTRQSSRVAALPYTPLQTGISP